MHMIKNLTQGNIKKSIMLFALPMMVGNFFQQLYNVVDSAIVGQVLGSEALGAVGSAFALMNFLTSILLGLCMGSSIMFSLFFGANDHTSLKRTITNSFYFIGFLSIFICLISLSFLVPILDFLNIPEEMIIISKEYIQIIFWGIPFIFLYQWSASLLRSLGNSKLPLYALIAACFTNIVLDVLFVVYLPLGVKGAAYATVIAQALSALICILPLYSLFHMLHFERRDFCFSLKIFKDVFSYSLLTSLQQSIMNFGILLIQGLVNSFGTSVMAAFSAAVKIDAFAYMPLQDYGNAFSTFIAQNKGANKTKRIQEGFRFSLIGVGLFSVLISIIVVFFGESFLHIFINAENSEIIHIGMNYLYIEGSFYILIGYLFLLYGLYRGLGKVGMSIILTIVSLGLRVVLSYAFSHILGLSFIWWSIVIGWFVADIIGFGYYFLKKTKEE